MTHIDIPINKDGTTYVFADSIQYLAEKTDARRIHIIGYSAETRVVAQAIDQLALMHACPGCNDSAKDLRIGHVIAKGAAEADGHPSGVQIAEDVRVVL